MGIKHIEIILWLSMLGLVFTCDQKKSIDGGAEQIAQVGTSKDEVIVYEQFDDMAFLFEHENDTTYVINFWATWCKPCVEELPYFDQLFKEYSDQKVKIVLVSLDFPKQIDSKLIPFITKHKILPEVVVLKDPDANAWIDRVSEDWDGAIPITLIYNRNRRLFLSGELDDYEGLKDKVESLVSK